jgi:hypothetical protein
MLRSLSRLSRGNPKAKISPAKESSGGAHNRVDIPDALVNEDARSTVLPRRGRVNPRHHWGNKGRGLRVGNTRVGQRFLRTYGSELYQVSTSFFAWSLARP